MGERAGWGLQPASLVLLLYLQILVKNLDFKLWGGGLSLALFAVSLSLFDLVNQSLNTNSDGEQQGEHEDNLALHD